MPTRLIITALCLFWSISLFAQEEFLNGVLLDAKTREPIPFATIRIKGYALGVISNMDGGFKIPEKFQGYGDILVISCMGYQKKEVLISDLYKETVNRIRLVPKVFELNEAVVIAKKKRKLSARAIVRRAIRAIPENYSELPFSTVGYYRDYQLKEDQYVNLNEAIFNVFDQGFDEIDHFTSKVKIYEYRQNDDFPRDSLALQPYNYRSMGKIIDHSAFLYDYGGNEFAILRIHDAIRNHKINSYSFVNRLRFDLLNNHSFKKGEDIYLEDEVLYQIVFQKKSLHHEAQGTLYISKQDFAIHKMEYAVYQKTPRKDQMEELAPQSQQQLLFKVITEYQRQYGNMFLNYISFNNRFEVRKPPTFVIDNVLVNPNRRVFVVKFTKEVSEKGVFNERNYRIKYKGRRVKFKKIVLFEKKVFLYPELESDLDVQTFSEIFELSKRMTYNSELLEPDSQILKIEIEGLVDTDGFKLNQKISEGYNQFREFFVQQIRPNTSPPRDSSYMDKNKPIFKDQPIKRPANFDEYWMNTPLKTVTTDLFDLNRITSNSGN